MLDEQLIKKYYDNCNKEEESALATLKTLMHFLNQDTSTTAIELSKNLRDAINLLKKHDRRIEVESIAEIYFRFITLSAAKFEVMLVYCNNFYCF